MFSDIHKSVRNKLQATKAALFEQQRQQASPVTLQVGDSVMIQVPERGSKLSPKFVGPLRVTQNLGGYKFEVTDHLSNTHEIVHSDPLKKTSAQPEKLSANVPPAEAAKACNSARRTNACAVSPPHSYNLRPRQ